MCVGAEQKQNDDFYKNVKNISYNGFVRMCFFLYFLIVCFQFLYQHADMLH